MRAARPAAGAAQRKLQRAQHVGSVRTQRWRQRGQRLLLPGRVLAWQQCRGALQPLEVDLDATFRIRVRIRV